MGSGIRRFNAEITTNNISWLFFIMLVNYSGIAAKAFNPDIPVRVLLNNTAISGKSCKAAFIPGIFIWSILCRRYLLVIPNCTITESHVYITGVISPFFMVLTPDRIRSSDSILLFRISSIRIYQPCNVRINGTFEGRIGCSQTKSHSAMAFCCHIAHNLYISAVRFQGNISILIQIRIHSYLGSKAGFNSIPCIVSFRDNRAATYVDSRIPCTDSIMGRGLQINKALDIQLCGAGIAIGEKKSVVTESTIGTNFNSMIQAVIIIDDQLCIAAAACPGSHTTGTFHIDTITELPIFDIHINSTRSIDSQCAAGNIDTCRINSNTGMIGHQIQVVSVHVNDRTIISTLHDRCKHVHFRHKPVIFTIIVSSHIVSAGSNGFIPVKGIITFTVIDAGAFPIILCLLSIIVIFYNLYAVLVFRNTGGRNIIIVSGTCLVTRFTETDSTGLINLRWGQKTFCNFNGTGQILVTILDIFQLSSQNIHSPIDKIFICIRSIRNEAFFQSLTACNQGNRRIRCSCLDCKASTGNIGRISSIMVIEDRGVTIVVVYDNISVIILVDYAAMRDKICQMAVRQMISGTYLLVIPYSSIFKIHAYVSRIDFPFCIYRMVKSLWPKDAIALLYIGFSRMNKIDNISIDNARKIGVLRTKPQNYTALAFSIDIASDLDISLIRRNMNIIVFIQCPIDCHTASKVGIDRAPIGAANSAAANINVTGQRTDGIVFIGFCINKTFNNKIGRARIPFCNKESIVFIGSNTYIDRMIFAVIIINDKFCVTISACPGSHAAGSLDIKAVSYGCILSLGCNRTGIIDIQSTTRDVNASRINADATMICYQGKVMALHIDVGGAVTAFHNRRIHIQLIHEIVIFGIILQSLVISAGRNCFITIKGIISFSIRYSRFFPVFPCFCAIIVIFYYLDIISVLRGCRRSIICADAVFAKYNGASLINFSRCKEPFCHFNGSSQVSILILFIDKFGSQGFHGLVYQFHIFGICPGHKSLFQTLAVCNQGNSRIFIRFFNGNTAAFNSSRIRTVMFIVYGSIATITVNYDISAAVLCNAPSISR